MRLIDADALKKVLEPMAKQMYDSLYGDGIYRALKEIDNAPTVEPEIPKGEWIKDSRGDTICLNCGFECLYNEEGLYSLGRYCHHCGADMTGGTE